MTARPLVADADLARMRFVDPARHDRAGIRHLYELPLVPAFSVAFDNAHARALYRCELNPRITGRDPDGSFTLDPTDVVPTELVGWAFHLPWERNPIPANKPSGKSHWTHTYRATAPVKQMGYALARAAKIGPQPRIRVRLDWEVVDRRTRDEDNLVPPMKALVDGIKTAGVVPDDHRTYVLRDMPIIRHAPKSDARPHAFMRLWVWKEPALASR